MVALFLLDEESEHIRPLGGAAKWWLHESLVKLRESLREREIPLILRRGPAEKVIPDVVSECEANSVCWNRRYGKEREHDANIEKALHANDVDVHSYPGDLLFEPWQISTKEGGPYRVYSAFWRACQAGDPPTEPLKKPRKWLAAKRQPQSDDLDSWSLQPTKPNWAGGLAKRWTPGEAAACRRLDRFLGRRVEDYDARRDFPAVETCSGLSPYLRWGEISPRMVWYRAQESGENVDGFLSEIGWREFARHTLFHFEDLHRKGLNSRFDDFPWQPSDSEEITAWQKGETGFGIVDAGMRELWETGFMHNRVRMITASFLTKNLLIDWRVGEEWFWDTLVDADAASNPFNWQWVAGCGADAAPYFRIFNPEAQQKKFDPDRRYVDRWAPDSKSLLEMVDLKETRARALAAYDSIKG